jgi:hypothetical protein
LHRPAIDIASSSSSAWHSRSSCCQAQHLVQLLAEVLIAFKLQNTSLILLLLPFLSPLLLLLL